jgi:hypothetical protein
MTSRRSERPNTGRLGRSTPGRGTRRQTSDVPKKRAFDATWPLFGESPGPAFPADPSAAVQGTSPPSADLKALAVQSAPSPELSRQATLERKRLRDSFPPSQPEWMNAAKALSNWLEQRIARGHVEPSEQAAIARTWAAFCLGGVTEPQIMRVAHIVQRAHRAIRDTPRQNSDLQAAIHAAAGVLHAGLPSPIRSRMPLERAVFVVRRLYEEADGWTAIVEGTTELLGWKDYARIHAASAIRAVLERSRDP